MITLIWPVCIAIGVTLITCMYPVLWFADNIKSYFRFVRKKPKKIPKILLELEEREKLQKQRHEQNLKRYIGNITKVSELPFDPSTTPIVQKFVSEVNSKSECLFAKKSKLWGTPPWDDTLSLEGNLERSLSALVLFTIIGEANHLDGFLFEAKGKQYFETIDQFAETVRRVLTFISDHDPAESNIARHPHMDRRGWRYTFNKEDIFVTTFAPCYPDNHARYLFGLQKGDSCFVLLQPEFSFGFHNIGEDHPWDSSKGTIRQKIRHNFEGHGRKYYVPEARFYPMAPMIVPPLTIGEPLIEWWLPLQQRKEVNVNDKPNE